jgi:mono/diheme cytochrome c family protein
MKRSLLPFVVAAAGLAAFLAFRLVAPAAAQPPAAARPAAGAQPAPPPATAAPPGEHTYASQCSACHMAYPPWLLPARSWRAIMGDLTNHFGEDASLSKSQTAAVLAFAVDHAADSPFGNPRVLEGLPASVTPTRITDLPVWRAIHREMLANGQMTLGTGPQAAANCGRCHGGGGGGEGGEGGGGEGGEGGGN